MLKENKRTARAAGVWWILFIIIGSFSYLVVDEKLLVPGDAAATLGNIDSNTALFLAGIAVFLVGYACFILLARALCKLFKTVDFRLTRWMMGFVIAGTALVLIGKFAEIAAVKAGSMEDAASLFNLRVNLEMASELFWGLWLIPLVALIFKSNLIPKVIGALALIAVAYHLAVFVGFFIGATDVSAQPVFAALGMIGELAIVLWLLLKGVKAQGCRPVI